MKMIGEHDHGVGRERIAFAYLSKCRTQFINVVGQQTQPPLRQVDGEEKDASGDKVTTIAGHGHTIKMMGFAALYPSYVTALLRSIAAPPRTRRECAPRSGCPCENSSDRTSRSANGCC